MTAVYTFDYDTTYYPPIPSVELTIGPAFAVELRN
jgi:hypothetical protein